MRNHFTSSRNAKPKTIRHYLKTVVRLLSLVFIIFAAGLFIKLWISDRLEFRDNTPDRGALAIASDEFGDKVNSTTYLQQNWQPQDSLWFYNITQGSDLMPYDFFLVLEQAENNKLFRSAENINHYRYLPQHKTRNNPDALPVGMVKDTYQGKAYMGYTCAACHTSQINYNGIGIRIDGGPSAADMENFMRDLADAMDAPLKGTTKQATAKDKAKLHRFIQAVKELGTYDDDAEIIADLRKFALRVRTYTVVNRPGNSEHEKDAYGISHAKHPMTHYGYARLDAFGRIFNRVLEHIMSASQLRDILENTLPPEELNEVMKGAEPILSNKNRDHILVKLQKLMTPKELLALRNAIYNPPDAPVSYPFLWDIPQHDYVQWNGIVANAGVGPIGRNAGQVIGVFGTLDWQEQNHWDISTILGGQGSAGPFVDFKSSINVRNLRRVESQLSKLQSPQWPENILGKIDTHRAERGEKIFNHYCAACHAEIDRASPTRRVVAQMTRVSAVGTDPKMAENSVRAFGYSGILRNMYVDTCVGKLLLEKKEPAAALLTMATRNTITKPDPDKWVIVGLLERFYDFATTFFDNEVQPSLKRGNYEPDTTVNPFASLKAYKGRSLNGIWATAPYLHNGSVPTLYDLLLPKKRAGDPESGEYRPDTFMVGSRQFIPEKVGFSYKPKDYPNGVGFEYRTSVPGNHNTGHEYAAGHTAQPDGTILPALDKEARLDLLEYLKTL